MTQCDKSTYPYITGRQFLADEIQRNLLVFYVCTLLQKLYRWRNNVKEPDPGILFPGITRPDADEDFVNCVKYLCNKFFFHFGWEVRLQPFCVIMFVVCKLRRKRSIRPPLKKDPSESPVSLSLTLPPYSLQFPRREVKFLKRGNRVGSWINPSVKFTFYCCVLSGEVLALLQHRNGQKT